MKSQKYKMTIDKIWKLSKQNKYKHNPGYYYKKGFQYDYTLPSGYYASQTWGALNKCWIGFVVAKDKYEWDKLEIYARRIQNLEKELEIQVTDFSDWGIE
jgi:hypothetical protein